MATFEYLISSHSNEITNTHYHSVALNDGTSLNEIAKNNIPPNAIVESIQIQFSGRISTGTTNFWCGFTNKDNAKPGEPIISDVLTTSSKPCSGNITSFSPTYPFNIMTPYTQIGMYASSGVIPKGYTCDYFKVVYTFSIPEFNNERDINFDNMFSFCSWATSSAKGEGTGSGTVSANLTGGVVTVKGHGDFYTTMEPHYTVPVEQGKEYVFRYDVTLNGSSQVGNHVQAFVFFVDNNGTFITDQATGWFFKHSYTGEHLYFVPPSGCTKVSFRFGVANSSVDVEATYSNIALYKTSLNTHEITNRQYRKAFENGSVVGILYKPERPGYVFQGWYTGENGTGQHIRKIDSAESRPILNGNTTVYSHWVKREYYDVNYDNLFSFSDWAYSLSGDSKGMSDNASYIGTITTNIPNGTVTVSGADPNGSGCYTAYGSFAPYHHIPVEPGQEYVFTYDHKVTSGSGGIQVLVFFCTDSQDFFPETGYWLEAKFDGTPVEFTAPAGCTNVCFRLGIGGISTVVFSNIGLYKKVDCNEETKKPICGDIRKNVAMGSTVGTLSTPSREGYAFQGWYTGENGAGAEIKSSDSFIKGVTAYSAWLKLHTVIFKDEDGETLKTETVADGSTVTAPYDPVKTDTAQWDYTFNGWYDANGNKWTSDTVITSDTVFTAQYTAVVQKYTIAASGENGTVTGGGTYEYGKTATLTATADKGYTFVKWSDGVETAIRTVTVTGGATYTAIFELLPPEIKSVQMIYLDKQISETNKVPCGEGFIISVELN